MASSENTRNKSPVRSQQKPKPTGKITTHSTSTNRSSSKSKSTIHENNKEEMIQLFTEIKLSEDAIKEMEQADKNLTERFAQDPTFDTIGIVNLSSMNLSDRDVPMIIQRAFRNKHKKCFGLNLRDNALTSLGIKVLVDEVIKLHANIRYICLSDNADVGDAGIEHIIRLLRTIRSLTFLAIPNTGMTDRGVRMLADALCNRTKKTSTCSPLEKLYISFNKLITDESLIAVLQIIERNHTLKVFSVQHCSFSNKARRQLKQAGAKMKKRRFSLSE